ncbi:MAG TPA: DUF445 family protein [Spirochaetota bacterium]|nr:DUF445 family protein [Spirochaetota bacterium]HOL57053.1 DUF445 family protein [Spirochaetota bacterium]HPP04331.1 DUF445 family protein [Spirochaetota bacterium]
MNIIRFIVYPILGAFLGYITNWIAITLLFRPRKKILGIQGLLEKRKELIARKAAEVIREYLFNTRELQKVLNKDKVKNSIDKLVDKTLSVVPSGLRKILSSILREVTYAYFFDKNGFIKDEIMELAITDTEFEKIVIDKINSYDISQIEKIIKKASGPEMMFILISGAVLGFIIGIIEALLPL